MTEKMDAYARDQALGDDQGPVNSKGEKFYACSCGRKECKHDWHFGNTPSTVTPPPGSDARTADGRFVSGPGYGGERM